MSGEPILELADKDISIYVQSLSIEDQEEIVAANQAQANLELAQGRNDLAPSPAFMMPPRPEEEPVKMRVWRIEQATRLEEKDAKEAEMMATLKAEAQKELNGIVLSLLFNGTRRKPKLPKGTRDYLTKYTIH